MFPEEVWRVNIGDLQDKNGGFVHLSWFNKGAKAANLGEGEFFKSDIFQHCLCLEFQSKMSLTSMKIFVPKKLIY